MTQIIPFEQRLVGDSNIETVDARDLHTFLGIGKDYSNWIKAQIKRAHLVENRDVVLFAQKGEYGNRPTKEYFLTFEAAKHIGMMSGSAKGYEVREYFIACEKALREAPATRGDLLVEMAEAYRRQERKILAMEAEQTAQRDALIVQQAHVIQALQASQDAAYKIAQVYADMGEMTIRQYVYTYKLEHQMPPAVQRAYIPHLKEHCLRVNAPFYKVTPGDKSWDAENKYPVAEIKATLESWLKDRHAQLALVPKPMPTGTP